MNLSAKISALNKKKNFLKYFPNSTFYQKIFLQKKTFRQTIKHKIFTKIIKDEFLRLLNEIAETNN